MTAERRPEPTVSRVAQSLWVCTGSKLKFYGKVNKTLKKFSHCLLILLIRLTSNERLLKMLLFRSRVVTFRKFIVLTAF